MSPPLFVTAWWVNSSRFWALIPLTEAWWQQSRGANNELDQQILLKCGPSPRGPQKPQARASCVSLSHKNNEMLPGSRIRMIFRESLPQYCIILFHFIRWLYQAGTFCCLFGLCEPFVPSTCPVAVYPEWQSSVSELPEDFYPWGLVSCHSCSDVGHFSHPLSGSRPTGG